MDFRSEEKSLPVVTDESGNQYYKIPFSILIYLHEASIVYKWYFNGTSADMSSEGDGPDQLSLYQTKYTR